MNAQKISSVLDTRGRTSAKCAGAVRKKRKKVSLFCCFGGKMKKWQTAELEFLTGGVGYGLLEILWRGRTHWSMVIAGGVSLVAVCAINKKMRSKHIALRAVAGAAFITAVEFTTGVLVNKLLNMGVWNYEAMFGNVLGQICPLYSFFWFLLCLPVCAVAGRIEKQ